MVVLRFAARHSLLLLLCRWPAQVDVMDLPVLASKIRRLLTVDALRTLTEPNAVDVALMDSSSLAEAMQALNPLSAVRGGKTRVEAGKVEGGRRAGEWGVFVRNACSSPLVG